MSPALVAQLLRFGTVGVSNTLLTLVAYTALTAVGVTAAAAAALGFCAGALNGYRLNRGWTFRSRLNGAAPAVRYVAVQLVGAALDALGVAAAVGSGHLPRMLGEVAILPPVTLLTFVLCRRWVFAGPRRA